ncbi:MAG: ABC-F family ATP-binding cassette domain-containing protein [Bacteroidota bacterium]
MINYLSIEQVSKSFGDKFLFEDLSFGIAQGQKIALIGVNGSGKSTLLKIVAGLEAPDSGKVSVRKGIRVAFLPQEPDLPEHLTVSECVFSADLPELKLIEQYEKLLSAENQDETQQEALSKVMAEIDALGAWDYEVKIKQILGKLEVDFLETYISELSGGQRKRVALAQALMGEPHLMIMDEPTNHLDLESIEWLEQFLSTSKQSLFLVTHDRYFLDSITNEIIELDQGELYSYKGDYAFFLEKKAERDALKLSETEKAKSLFKTELEWLSRSPKARTSKSKSRIDAALELGEKTKYRAPNQDVKLQVKGRRIGGKVLEIKNLRKSYGELNILDNFTYTFARRDRIGIVGPNGVGKTTFLRLIMGEEIPDSGKIRLGDTIVIGYYKQSGFAFKDNQRVIEVVTEAAEEVELSKSQTVSAATLLEHFLFPRSMHSNFVETLSGGERRRLHLLRILMTNPNFLILDEPTNDLDLITLRRLEEFLESFEGCLLVVTHDRFFMDRLVDHVFVFQGKGQIKDYPGSYSQYREWQAKQEAEKEAVSIKVEKSTTEKTKSNNKRKLSFNEKREFEQLEVEIDQMESRKTEITQLMNEGGSDFEKLAELSQELEKLNADLDTKSDRWLELMEIIESA